MSNHKIHFAGLEPSLQARCACRQRSPIGSRQECEEWQIAHLAEIQRIRSHLSSRTITLPRQQAWFAEQADNPDVSPEDRALWRQLAEETGAYIARKSALLDQDPLF